MYICQFCDKTYTTAYSLERHKQTAKSCLEDRDKNINTKFICEDCKQEFTRKSSLQRHYRQCHVREMRLMSEDYEARILDLEDMIEEHRMTIEELYLEIKNLQDRPTTTIYNDNRTVNIDKFIYAHPITKDRLEDQASKLTIDHVSRGSAGLARYAYDFPLHNSIRCIDYTRKKVAYLDENGNEVTDFKFLKLTPQFFQSIEPTIIERAAQQYAEICKLDDEDLRTLRQTRLDSLVTGVKNGINRKQCDFTESWKKDLIDLFASGSEV